jgi:cardiolipin-specific phospholipase
MPSVETVSQREGAMRNEGLPETTDSGRKLPHSVTHGMAPTSSAWLPLGMKETIHQWVSPIESCLMSRLAPNCSE